MAGDCIKGKFGDAHEKENDVEEEVILGGGEFEGEFCIVVAVFCEVVVGDLIEGMGDGDVTFAEDGLADGFEGFFFVDVVESVDFHLGRILNIRS